MTRRRFRAPSPAMVIACLALFLGLSGTVYAGVKIAKNSIGSGEIKNKSIKGGDLADDTITGEQVDESTLGVVPRAATAGTATAATSAATAGTAKSADRASTAGLADKATAADRATYADRAGTATTASTADKATAASTADKATSADKATEADHAANADKIGGHGPGDFTSSSAMFPVVARLAGGETRTLVSRDGVRLDARCTVNEAVLGSTTPQTATVLRIYAYSTAAGATLESPWSTFDGSSSTAFLGPDSGSNGLALKTSSTTGSNVERVPSSGIILTSAGGARRGAVATSATT